VAQVNVIPDLGGSFAYLLRTGPRSRLGLARGRGPASGSTGTALAWILIEGGSGEFDTGIVSAQIDGRDDVFEGPGWSVLIGPKTRFALRGNLSYSVAWRAWTIPEETRVITPKEVEIEGSAGKSLRVCVREGPMIVGESVQQPGVWSSWPPHRHEQEEVSLYRFDPKAGLGMRILDTREGDRRAEVLRDGDFRRQRSGFHAAAATPGATMYALWVMSGASTKVEPEPDDRVA
jgi:5-deoxy-glucuronate isomerase